MSGRSLEFLIPGDLQAPTGGYGYDRRIIAGLQQLGWRVSARALAESFPFPTAAALEQADGVLSQVPDGGLVLVDGLALGAMPEVAARHASRVRLVALVHHPLAAETGLSCEMAQRLEQSERASLRSVRHVVVTSEATARGLARYGVDRSRITVIVPGTDVAPIARGSEVMDRASRGGDIDGLARGGRDIDGPARDGGDVDDPARSGAASDGPGRGDGVHLLCVATITPRKGYDLLIDALAPLASLPWRLSCVGSLTRSAETAAALREQIRRFGLQPKIALLGELTGDALESAFQSADLFVLPTRYEGYGMVVAEALARGIPVLSTRTGAIPELVGTRAGLLVPPGDGAALHEALARILHSPTFLASLRDGAVARDDLPRWPESCARMSQLLERVMAA